MKRLIHLSNRVDIPKAGQATAGGLDEAIAAAPEGYEVMRIGWSGTVIADQDYDPAEAENITTKGGITYVTMDFSQSMHDGFYAGTANSYLWPLFHYRNDIAGEGFSPAQNRIYFDTNRKIADLASRHIEPDDTVIVHDYHLIPLGQELIAHGINNPLGFFLHIPVPDASLLSDLPKAQQDFVQDLLDRLHAYDLVGLQSRRDFEALESVIGFPAGNDAPLPFTVRHIPDLRNTFKRHTQFGVVPVIGRTGQYIKQAEEWESRPETLAFLNDHGPAQIIGVERLDYSKGIPNKLTALAICMQQGKAANDIRMLQIAPFGRESVKAYQIEKAKVEQGESMLREVFGDVAHVHMDKVPRPINLGMMRQSKVGLVTPLRDGMNLVAFEYLAAQNPADPGVLVLSKFAGAAEVLKDAAVLVHPYQPRDIARGIQSALAMPLAQRQALHQKAMDVMGHNTNEKWQKALVEETVKAAQHRPGV